MKSSHRPCPLCGGEEVLPLANLEFGDFDSSSFERRVVLVACRFCGQAFNDVALNQEALELYYRDEALYAADMGIGSGGTGPWDQKRYADTLGVLAPFLPPSQDAAIVDVGCAKGGFLAFLHEQGYTNLAGVDLNRDCVDFVQNTLGIPATVGTVHHLPYDDRTAAVLVYSHVLEHVDNLGASLKEAWRVLRDDGLLLVEVPDASRYADYPVFDFYWLSQKEHINHFDAVHLTFLAQAAGFQPLQVGTMLMSMAPQVKIPLLYGVFQKRPPNHGSRRPYDEPGLRQSLQGYVQAEDRRLAPRRRLLKELAASGRPAYAWGIGLEFFCLYAQAGLRDCNLRYLVDKNQVKQKQTVDGFQIHPPECFAAAPAEATAVLTSALHSQAMASYLRDIAFPGEVLALA